MRVYTERDGGHLKVKSMGPEITDGRGISSNSIEHLRSILVSSLPQENVGLYDRKRVEHFKKVKFNHQLGERAFT